MRFYLVKTEPGTYAWSNFEKDGRTMWEGVRNFAARLHLRSMQKDDLVLFYHSGEDKAVFGIAKVARPAYQDPTTTEDWSVVDLTPVQRLKRPVSLAAIKAEPSLKDIYLIRQSRLSVMPLKKEEFDRIVMMGK